MTSIHDLAEEAIHATAIEAAELNLIKVLGLKPYKDGNMWCFLFGDDLQSGVSGFGETVMKAIYDFNKNFHAETIPLHKPDRDNSMNEKLEKVKL